MTEARTATSDHQPRRAEQATQPRRRLPDLGPLPWIGPALLLIFAVVLWPAFEMARTSVLDISLSGLARGFIGLANFERLFANPDFLGILLRTLTWVVIVVGVTILISLGLASLLNAAFPGRRFVRWALIIPWAASVVMTATIWRWMLDGFYGIINRILLDLGLLAAPINDWLGDPSTAFIWLMFVAIFVSLPFTTYVLLAGLQSIPKDIYEAGRGRRCDRLAQLPLASPCRCSGPALLVASIINMINVFNSFPIIWAMTRGGPGSLTDTTTTHMYKLAFRFRTSASRQPCPWSTSPSSSSSCCSTSASSTGGGRDVSTMHARPRTPTIKKALLTGHRRPGGLLLHGARTSRCSSPRCRRPTSSYSVPAQYLPSRFEFSNFITVWEEAPLWGYLRSSLIISVFATLLVLLVALPAAYYTARYRYRGRLLFLLLVLITQMFAPTALVIGIYREFVSHRRHLPVRRRQHLPLAHHRQRRLQPGLLDLDHGGLLLDHPGRAGGSGGDRRRVAPGRAARGSLCRWPCPASSPPPSSPSSLPGTSSSSP